MICPVQRWGIGDIIFEQTLVRAFNEPVIWVVQSAFVEGLQRAYPDMTFTDVPPQGYNDMRKDEYTVNGVRFLPLRWADVMLNVPYRMCMQAKYLLYGLDWQIWKDMAMWRRDVPRETELREMLGIAEGEAYNLINRTFRTDNSGKVDISVNNGLRNIEMRSINGFSLFDWSGIIESATEIHTVSTSIIYILEMLELKAKSVDLYVRKPDEHNFENIGYILQKHRYIQHL